MKRSKKHNVVSGKYFNVVPVEATIKKINKHGALGGFIEIKDEDYRELKRRKDEMSQL